MRLRGKYLCWFAVMAVFLGGCGGSNSSITGSEDVTVPDSNAVISGTWCITSGTYGDYEKSDLQGTTPETFTLTVEYDGEKYPVPFSAEGSDYVLTEDGSGYVSEEYGAIDAVGRPVHVAGDTARGLFTEGNDTLQYGEDYVDPTATHWETRMTLTLKRVN